MKLYIASFAKKPIYLGIFSVVIKCKINAVLVSVLCDGYVMMHTINKNKLLI